MKIYAGNHPDTIQGWEVIARLEDENGLLWFVYRKPQDHSDEWITYKIVAEAKAFKKANYWLARNRVTGQIGFARDFAMMRSHRPLLHKSVERVLAA
jgi:hypothetical protein